MKVFVAGAFQCFPIQMDFILPHLGIICWDLSWLWFAPFWQATTKKNYVLAHFFSLFVFSLVRRYLVSCLSITSSLFEFSIVQYRERA